ncbi:hypothetical protein CEY00_Acc14577 [Actinidia chinensis var. chinensis]|uniref:Uncharacterized protein n=1 Tax=Actinidia chinensis var. chinensis TaxID=1590841 RepID=A0A2R6QS61_ACTCC|nr:hypothetical protein CEY00_Acc14577 [Actinidia chinensis var. chinensis]
MSEKATNQRNSAEPRKKPDKAARKHRSRSLLEIYAQTAVIEQGNNPGSLPSPAENSNKNGNKNSVPASVTDDEPRRASRRLAGKQPEYSPTLSDIEACEATRMRKSTRAISGLAKHQPEHIPNPAREVTNELEPRRESRRLPRIVIKRVPANI